MKNERTALIAQELRTTDKKQGKHALHRIWYDPIKKQFTDAFCCMGVMCEVANIRVSYDPTEDLQLGDAPFGDEENSLNVSYEGATCIPPHELFLWLGLYENKWDVPATTLYLDADEVIVPIKPSERCYSVDPERNSTTAPLGNFGLEVFNDHWNFTFSQIADLIDYFGLKAERLRRRQSQPTSPVHANF